MWKETGYNELPISENLTLWPLSTISSKMNETSRSSTFGILSFFVIGTLSALLSTDDDVEGGAVFLFVTDGRLAGDDFGRSTEGAAEELCGFLLSISTFLIPMAI